MSHFKTDGLDPISFTGFCGHVLRNRDKMGNLACGSFHRANGNVPPTKSLVALAASAIGFAVTLARPDPMPAVPYVDQILYTSFDVHAGAGLAVIAGSALLLVPAIIGCHRDTGNGGTYIAFGAVWFAAIAAAALGNHPTPIVGYGGSAIIGYVLSLLALPKLVETNAGAVARTGGDVDSTLPGRHLLVGVA